MHCKRSKNCPSECSPQLLVIWQTVIRYITSFCLLRTIRATRYHAMWHCSEIMNIYSTKNIAFVTLLCFWIFWSMNRIAPKRAVTSRGNTAALSRVRYHVCKFSYFRGLISWLEFNMGILDFVERVSMI